MKISDVEKFPAADLTDLRDELTRSGLDSWQAAELISAFLSGRGYGVSPTEARTAAIQCEGMTGSLAMMQAELEKLAFVM